MEIVEEQIIGELVAQNYKTASVFKKFKIDFCCNGNRTISEACERKKLDAAVLINELNKIIISQEQNIDFNSWELDLLADYIEKTHHRYVIAKIKEIKPYLNKVVKVHGNHNPELKEIEILFNQSAQELSQHLQKEEMVLFPFIRNMVNSKIEQKPLLIPHFGTVENPISMMKNEHQNEGERFEKIAELSNNYTPPSHACNTYRVTFALLKEFEDNLHQHIHLENNILFPKAIHLEKEFH
jgi:regulator of cell morphogenesis and NO signaling